MGVFLGRLFDKSSFLCIFRNLEYWRIFTRFRLGCFWYNWSAWLRGYLLPSLAALPSLHISFGIGAVVTCPRPSDREVILEDMGKITGPLTATKHNRAQRVVNILLCFVVVRGRAICISLEMYYTQWKTYITVVLAYLSGDAVRYAFHLPGSINLANSAPWFEKAIAVKLCYLVYRLLEVETAYNENEEPCWNR